MFRAYYNLTKPGIIYGNALAAIAGFLFAAKGHIDIWLFISLLAGTSLVIASGCVFNNYLERDIDKHMKRTSKRATVTGIISGRSTLIYGALLGLAGFLVLALFTNTVTMIIGAIGFIDYVFFYTLSKRYTVHSTLIGSISGATPPVAGYTAVTGHFDVAALLLFVTMTVWQMPHFYAIAMRRADEYRAAKLPVLAVKYGMAISRVAVLAYVAAYLLVAPILSLTGYASITFGVASALIGLYWLYLALANYRKLDDKAWAGKMFFFSLKVLLAWCVLLSVDWLLP